MPITLTPTPTPTPVTTTPLAKWYVVVPPTDHPVPYADLLTHLRVDNTDPEDEPERFYIETLIDAATDYAQDSLCMSLMPQTIAAVFNAEDVGLTPPIQQYDADPLNPAGAMNLATSAIQWGTIGRAPVVRLPRGPVSAIVSVVDANENDVAGCSLERTPAGDRLRLTQTSRFPIVVTYQAGYADQSSIPAGIRVAIMAHVGTLYENRESIAAAGAKVIPHSMEDFYRLKGRRSFAG